MTQQGSAADIRYLLRVWSMEVHVDYGNFPPCSLLWIKQMDLKNHVQKWRDSQYQNNQRQIVKAEVSALNEVAFQTAMRRYHEGKNESTAAQVFDSICFSRCLTTRALE